MSKNAFNKLARRLFGYSGLDSGSYPKRMYNVQNVVADQARHDRYTMDRL